MTPLIKICGLKAADALHAALDAGADMVGFVFFPPSPRNVPLELAHALGSLVGSRALKVALSVNAEDSAIEAMVAALAPDMLQLHGSETPERVSAVKRRFGRPVIKAVPVESQGDLRIASAYETVADRILFDARPPRGATRPGGLGRTFDWRLLAELDLQVPFVLSGGLNTDNVATALAVTRASAVDVSSGVERAPGDKDPDLIRAFIRAVHEAAVRAPATVTSRIA